MLKLHEAMIAVLIDAPNRTLTFKEVAHHVNERKLYTRKDQLPVPSNQIRARAFASKQRYSHYFEKVGTDRLKLRNESPN